MTLSFLYLNRVTLSFLYLTALAIAVPILAGTQQRALSQHLLTDYNGDTLVVTEYTPPAIYAQWWKEIAVCEGLPVLDSTEQAKFQFFSVPSASFTGSGLLAVSMIYQKELVIYVAAPHVWRSEDIKHEMLHALLYLNGYNFKAFHPIELFERCGIHRTGDYIPYIPPEV